MPGKLQQTTKVVNLHECRCLQWDLVDLQKIVDDLASAGHVTELGFLELGSNIKRFHDLAHGISRTAGGVLHLLHGDAGENTLQRLQMLVERCDLWLASSVEKSLEISELLKVALCQIAELDQPVASLRKVIKTLHSLRVSTRIEAAKSYASGASVLAKSLDELGVLIHEKTSGICARTENLEPLIKRSLQMEAAAQAVATRTAGQEVQKARRMLNGFMANCIATGQWTDRLKKRSDEVTLSFGEMIASLQFQDITRQRFEHVQKALTNLMQHLEKIDQTVEDRRAADVIRLCGHICRLQHDQLSLACQEFCNAAENLSENLNLMANSALSMAADTRELSLAAGFSSEQNYDAVLDVLRMIADCLLETHEVHLATGTHLADVCLGIQEVSALVTDIEMLGEEMQLLAMNAAINAAHARQQGAGLDIIAQNIHVAADEATGLSLVLARECTSITGHASRLQELQSDAQANSGDVTSLLEEARQRMAAIEGNAARLVSMVTEVDRTAARLVADVAQAAKINSVRDDFQEKLTPVLKRLDTLGRSADTESAEAGSSNLEVLFKNLEYCYTMDSERRVHQQFIDKDNPLISSLSAEDDEWSANRHHDLGDNVDLF